MKNTGISFTYSPDDFDEVRVEQVRKETAQDVGDGVDDAISPAHVCFKLEDRRSHPAFGQGPGYFFPACSFICSVPLADSSVEDFSKAYPGLDYYAADLHRLLRDRPAAIERRRAIPDFPSSDTGPAIVSRYQYLDFRSGSGILFLTQYSNERQPNPVNNEELTLVFQGLTQDGKHYVAARFAITHPSLPAGIDCTDHIERDMPGFSYLRKAERVLDGLADESFRPSMNSLKALLSSIHIN